jgi:hypothetical protein
LLAFLNLLMLARLLLLICFPIADLFAPDAAERLPTMIGTASASHTTPSPTPRELVSQIEYLRNEKFPESAIREMLDETGAYSPEIHEATKARLEEFSSDPEFRRKLFEADSESATS